MAAVRFRIMADLIVMAFFFLLRVGEYTPSYQDHQTVPLHKKDVRLWRDKVELDRESPLHVLLLADAVTICLENQKNGHRHTTAHHASSGDPLFDPVPAVARLLFALHGMPPDTALGTHKDERGKMCQI